MNLDELGQGLVRLDERVNAHEQRIKGLEGLTKAVSELASSMQAMVIKQEGFGRQVESLTADIQSIKEKPSKRWDSIIDKCITAAAAALIGYLFSKLGIV